MFATVHQFRRSLNREIADWGRQLAARPGTGCLGVCTLAQVAGTTGAVVAFWPSRDRADAALTSPPGDWTWLDAKVCRVDFTGSAPGRPRYAQLTWFDGPRREDVAEAELRGGRERIWPAVSKIDGIGDCYVLRGDDLSGLVLGFADSVETIEAAQRTVMSTELLPGEDPAMLPGPDRMDLCHVVFAELPVPAAAGDPR
ncbi:hypothetical protein [Amycolatopsis sp. GM8]|uniref:hypothetical protein n=1 Tax=Amycolatopsis sp. GM8 TaxID=2896530 RepID=UPI001F1DD0AB|nr:hypothetical protein [Amycolatopsis sp. GM8]